MKIQYLEIVTPEVAAVCDTYVQLHGVAFGDSDPSLGGARVAALEGGGAIGVRAPLLPPMELPGHGICAIVIQGGIESGFWQL